jgi:hypothetical protein
MNEDKTNGERESRKSKQKFKKTMAHDSETHLVAEKTKRNSRQGQKDNVNRKTGPT